MKADVRLTILGVCLFFFGTQISPAQTTQGPTNFNGATTTQVVNVNQTGSGFALKASTPSTSGVGAIFGQATGTSGFNNGVWGRSFSPAGVAVRGENMAKTGSATGGAFFTSSTHGLGLFGSANAASGFTVVNPRIRSESKRSRRTRGRGFSLRHSLWSRIPHRRTGRDQCH